MELQREDYRQSINTFVQWLVLVRIGKCPKQRDQSQSKK